MATLQDIRQQYPQYNDLSDQELADKLYQKHYSDMPRAQFDQKIGLVPFQQVMPPHTPTPTDPIRGTGLGAVLPLSVTRQGNLQWDMPPILENAINAATMPGDVAPNLNPVMETPGFGTHKPGSQPVFGQDPQTGGVAYAPGVHPAISPFQSSRMGDLTALFGPMNPAVRAGDLPIPGEKMNTAIVTPTMEGVKAAGNEGYDVARKIPSDYDPNGLGMWSIDQQTQLEARGLTDIHAPDTIKVLQRYQNPAPGAGPVTGGDIISLRKQLQNIAEGAAKTFATNPRSKDEYGAAVDAISSLDQFIANPGQASVGGYPDIFNQVYTEARQNRAAAYRAGDVAKKQAVAEVRAAGAGSGQNLGNTLRQRAGDLLKKNIESEGKFLRGWTDEEVKALEFINGRGGMVGANSLRRVSNWLGGGGGAVQSILTGAAGIGGTVVGGPVVGAALGATPIIAGSGTRWLHNKAVSSAIDRLEEQLLKRSPIAEQAVGTAVYPQGLANVLRMMLLGRPAEKPPAADQLYLDAKKQHEAQKAADEQMLRPGIY